MNINTYTGDIINFVIETELEQFKQDFQLSQIHYSQDISSLSILWLCFYFKENVSVKNTNAITNFVTSIMQSETYNTDGWSKISALQAASFALTNNEWHLNALLQNLSCQQATNRIFILKSISIICPIIPFNNEYFENSVRENIIKKYIGDEYGIVMYLLCNGVGDEKTNWFKEISELKEFQSNKSLVELYAGKSISCNFFKETFYEIKSHILFRILKHSYSYNNQTNLFEDNNNVSPKTLNYFQDSHPLDNERFQFNINDAFCFGNIKGN